MLKTRFHLRALPSSLCSLLQRCSALLGSEGRESHSGSPRQFMAGTGFPVAANLAIRRRTGNANSHFGPYASRRGTLETLPRITGSCQLGRAAVLPDPTCDDASASARLLPKC